LEMNKSSEDKILRQELLLLMTISLDKLLLLRPK